MAFREPRECTTVPLGVRGATELRCGTNCCLCLPPAAPAATAAATAGRADSQLQEQRAAEKKEKERKLATAPRAPQRNTAAVSVGAAEMLAASPHKTCDYLQFNGRGLRSFFPGHFDLQRQQQHPFHMFRPSDESEKENYHGASCASTPYIVTTVGRERETLAYVLRVTHLINYHQRLSASIVSFRLVDSGAAQEATPSINEVGTSARLENAIRRGPTCRRGTRASCQWCPGGRQIDGNLTTKSFKREKTSAVAMWGEPTNCQIRSLIPG